MQRKGRQSKRLPLLPLLPAAVRVEVRVEVRVRVAVRAIVRAGVKARVQGEAASAENGHVLKKQGNRVNKSRFSDSFLCAKPPLSRLPERQKLVHVWFLEHWEIFS